LAFRPCAHAPFPAALLFSPHPRRLNEASGATAYDCSGYGRNAAYAGGVTLAGLTRGSATRFYPAANVAPLFDGATGYLALPTIPSYANAGGPLAGSYSVEMWLDFTTVPAVSSSNPYGVFYGTLYSLQDATAAVANDMVCNLMMSMQTMANSNPDRVRGWPEGKRVQRGGGGTSLNQALDVAFSLDCI